MAENEELVENTENLFTGEQEKGDKLTFKEKIAAFRQRHPKGFIAAILGGTVILAAAIVLSGCGIGGVFETASLNDGPNIEDPSNPNNPSNPSDPSNPSNPSNPDDNKDQAKREFAPSADQIKTFQAALGNRIVTLTGAYTYTDEEGKEQVQLDYNESSKSVTVWFNAKGGDRKAQLVSMEFKTGLDRHSFNTQDVVNALKVAAGKDGSGVDIRCYRSLEDVTVNSGDQTQTVVGAINNAAGKVVYKLTSDGKTVVEQEVQKPVWVSLEKQSSGTYKVRSAEGGKGIKVSVTEQQSFAGDYKTSEAYEEAVKEIAKSYGVEVSTETEPEM